MRELADVNMVLEAAVDAVFTSRRALREQYTEVYAWLVALAKGDAVCQLMMSMRGVGAIIALIVKSAIDDPERFKSSKDVGPWSGLTPKRSQSGEMDIVGHITKVGDASLRAALYYHSFGSKPPASIRNCFSENESCYNQVLSRDHVHMFVSVPSKLAVADLIPKMKGRSSYKLQREFP